MTKLRRGRFTERQLMLPSHVWSEQDIVAIVCLVQESRWLLEEEAILTLVGRESE